jgi:hypothetical protein
MMEPPAVAAHAIKAAATTPLARLHLRRAIGFYMVPRQRGGASDTSFRDGRGSRTRTKATELTTTGCIDLMPA